MKSVAFFRNTWKKWEQKTFDTKDDSRSNTRRESQIPATHSRSSGRSLILTVKQQPLEDTTASVVQGTWRPSKASQPSSPVSDEFYCRGEHTFVHRTHSRFAIDDIYRAQGAPYGEAQRSSSDSMLSVKKSTMHILASPDSASTRPKKSSMDASQVTPARASPTRQRLASSPSSPRHPTLPPSPPILPSADLDRGSAKPSDSPEGNICHCGRLAGSSHSCRCPRFDFEGAQTSMTNSNTSEAPPPAYSATVQPTSRRLYNRTTESSPHLPYQEPRSPSSATSTLEPSSTASSAEGTSDTGHFPLSLFPAPPPLFVRRKITAPLVIRTALSGSSSQSSRDSTPVGTPTTPRFQPPAAAAATAAAALHSPSQLPSVASPTKKVHHARSTACISPPPFSPPNSPLPSLPLSSSSEKRPHHQSHHLRMAQSTVDLRTALPFPATHRLTTSEPISDQTSLPIRKTARHRYDTTGRARDLQPPHVDTIAETIPTAAPSEVQVQWGYAI